MILNESKRSVQSTLPNQQAFQIRTSAKAFEILSSGLYNNKEAAVIRELACNAHDAHVADKNPKPFEISFPTKLNPTLVVTDYGTGLDEDSMHELYTTYFSSNKTDSNLFTGALGLGSKSPFSISDQFTVESRYKNTKSSYVCFITEDGVPSISKLNSEAYKGKSGITITIPVNSETTRKNLIREASNVLKYFKTTPIVHNLSESIINIYSNKNIIVNGSNWRVLKRSTYRDKNFSFIQSNVSYTISYSSLLEIINNHIKDTQNRNIVYSLLTSITKQDYQLSINMVNGDLNFTASREELSMDALTKRNIAARILKVAKEYTSSQLKEIDNCGNIQDVLEIAENKESAILLNSCIKTIQTNNVSISYSVIDYIDRDSLINYLKNLFKIDGDNLGEYLVYKIPQDYMNTMYKLTRVNSKYGEKRIKKIKFEYAATQQLISNQRFFYLDLSNKPNTQSSILKEHVRIDGFTAIVVTDKTVNKYLPKNIKLENVTSLKDIRIKKTSSSNRGTFIHTGIHLTPTYKTSRQFDYNHVDEIIEENPDKKIIYAIRSSKIRSQYLINGKGIEKTTIIQAFKDIQFKEYIQRYIVNNFHTDVIDFPVSQTKSKQFKKYEENFINLEDILLYMVKRISIKHKKQTFYSNIFSKINLGTIDHYLENKDILEQLKDEAPILTKSYKIFSKYSNSTNIEDQYQYREVQKGFTEVINNNTKGKVIEIVDTIKEEIQKIYTKYSMLTLIPHLWSTPNTEEANIVLQYLKSLN